MALMLTLALAMTLSAAAAAASSKPKIYGTLTPLEVQLADWPREVGGDHADTLLLATTADSAWTAAVRGVRANLETVERWDQAAGWLTTDWRTRRAIPGSRMDAALRDTSALSGNDPDPDAARIHDQFAFPDCPRCFLEEVAQRYVAIVEATSDGRARVIIRHQIVATVRGRIEATPLVSLGGFGTIIMDEVTNALAQMRR